MLYSRANATKHRLQRRRRALGRDRCVEEETAYKLARKQYGTAIRKAQERAWAELINQVDQDVWGYPYQLVMKRLKGNQPIPGISLPGRVERIMDGLFPTRRPLEVTTLSAISEYITPFTHGELSEAVRRMPNGKAPGLDGLMNEVIKLAARSDPQGVLAAYNCCLEKGIFPRQWKLARLVLLRKGNKPVSEPSSFRPICLLDGLGKIFERLILNRLEITTEASGGLSINQYGFRRGRSTADAIRRVHGVMEEANSGTWRTKRYCILVTLDVKNAFNSASWAKILEALRKLCVPEYLQAILGSYLRDRVVRYVPEDGSPATEKHMSCGVPQGSVLGPVLWNVMYDAVLRIKLPEGVEEVGYADDIGVVASARSIKDLEINTNKALQMIERVLKELDLELAAHKTEAVLLTGRRRIVDPPHIMVGGKSVVLSRSIRYLGVYFDTSRKYTDHIRRVVQKTAATTSALSRIMPNVGGPRQCKRKLLTSVTMSQMMYGAEVWAPTLGLRRYFNMLTRVQRRAALRVICGYRTISADAAGVLAGMPPVDLLAGERRSRRISAEKGEDPVEAKNSARMAVMETWQSRWNESQKGRWTWKLIPDIVPWVTRRHGQVSYRLTQILTGHGCFGSYLVRIGKLGNARCPLCEDDVDDAEHALFHCGAYEKKRWRLRCKLGINLSAENTVPTMLDSREAWSGVVDFCEEIMKGREELERQRKGCQTVPP